jgi:hypothetical protein
MSRQASDDVELTAALDRANNLKRQGDVRGALQVCLETAERVEPVPAVLCLTLVRAYLALDEVSEAIRWATSVVDAGDDLPAWQSAASLIKEAAHCNLASRKRTARVAVAGNIARNCSIHRVRCTALSLISF